MGSLNKRKFSFELLINEDSEKLILGTMPGKESLEKQQYYANKRNQFWIIIYKLFNKEYINEKYENKIRLLLENRIALWDVLDSCEREGSLDANIKKEKENNFEYLFSEYPKIEKVFFNGKKAYTIFKKNVGFTNSSMQFFCLPSTSPAHAVRIEQKLQKWKTLLE